MSLKQTAAIAGIVLLSLTGCDVEDVESGGSGKGKGKHVTNANWERVFENPDDYAGATVRLVAQVYDRDGDVVVAWGDFENADQPAMISGDTAGLSADDFVLVRGTIAGGDSYETVLGDTQEVVAIDGSSVREVSQDRARVLADPPTAKRMLNLSKTQGLFTVTIESIAWTSKSTLLRVAVSNGSSQPATLEAYDVAIQQGSRQYELSDEDTGAADELSEDIRPGVKKAGVLTFERISQRRGEADIEFGWFSDDFDIDPRPFRFNLTW